MTTIAIPAWLPTEPELQVTEASGAVLTDVRAAATAVDGSRSASMSARSNSSRTGGPAFR